jgi:hypothetical protein
MNQASAWLDEAERAWAEPAAVQVTGGAPGLHLFNSGGAEHA